MMEETDEPINEAPESKPKFKLNLPRMEMLIIVVLFFSFLIWMIPKCSSTRLAMEDQALEEAREDSLANLSVAQMETPPPPPVEKVTKVVERMTPLYVTIDNMNLRGEPNLKSRIITKLKLFEEIQFMNEVTPFEQTITLGDSTVVQPWVKVKTKKGAIGWVYGAGVHYYKTKFAGME